MFDLVDMRMARPKNLVQGRWILTIIPYKDDEFDTCKARWVLKGFQDRQTRDVVTVAGTLPVLLYLKHCTLHKLELA